MAKDKVANTTENTEKLPEIPYKVHAPNNHTVEAEDLEKPSPLTKVASIVSDKR